MARDNTKNRLLLFICTGNVCRSPMAEYLMRAALGPRSSWAVASAGMMAANGMGATDEAAATLRARGIDMRRHRSRALTRQLVDAAALIVVMTRSHRDQVEAQYPEARAKVYLLKTFDPQAVDPDVDDPIGMPIDVYAETCEEIASALPGLMRYMDTFQKAKPDS